MKKETYNLGEERVGCSGFDKNGFELIEYFYSEESVKEFIKLLKASLKYQFEEGDTYVDNLFKELAGNRFT